MKVFTGEETEKHRDGKTERQRNTHTKRERQKDTETERQGDTERAQAVSSAALNFITFSSYSLCLSFHRADGQPGGASGGQVPP